MTKSEKNISLVDTNSLTCIALSRRKNQLTIVQTVGIHLILTLQNIFIVKYMNKLIIGSMNA